ncbi:hypothetical protein AMAG_15543 [Allomyces macrogynus ATCC 38327]|uniref:GDP-Man:Man(3)GlcNAc(2)-PP-Dol alpha-1,2-mannosyltransferase n=1 Tax=Allomyces macrogynus (strain ATCC 38327) TaxID=578462 RepID=A0A0L0T913_ALLM3|nr:hypothetical protein AMAG_15543 [Allomyces macrogynus ATCC 38327]|eukprot:KNE71303.1 hypothetical protein AMAG_15543 [Allomyces macrogynus ATCC 38327]
MDTEIPITDPDTTNHWLQPVLAALAVIFATWIALTLRRSHAVRQRLANLRDPNHPTTIAFFHPFCHAGGGGERVLWMAVRTVQHRWPKARCVVYTGDVGITATDILDHAENRFDLTVDRKRVEFEYLSRRRLVEDSTYPRFTLLGQSLGSVVLVWDAIRKGAAKPDLYIDTMGYAFTYPLVKLLVGCPVISYTHYPTISTDMIAVVADRKGTFNNDAQIAKSSLLSRIKLVYYRFFARLYSWSGRHADMVMVNSSWTANHIHTLFRTPTRTRTVYPPCGTATFLDLPLTPRTPTAVSIAQFRPEKNHLLQIDAMALVHAQVPHAKLVVMGSARHAEDTARVHAVLERAREKGIDHVVEVVVNAPWKEVRARLGAASVALHTMRDEHFGIGVVEAMAAGVVPLAHRSGGPKADIVVPYRGVVTGFLAESVEEYAYALVKILTMDETERVRIQENARLAVAERFSDVTFEKAFVDAVEAGIEEYGRRG